MSAVCDWFRWRWSAGVAALLLGLGLVFGSLAVSPAAADVGGAIRPTHSGLCLDAEGDSTAPGSAIVQDSCDGSDGQSYRLRRIGGGLVEIVNVANGLCIGIADAATQPGAPVRQRDCDGTSSSLFQLDQLEGRGRLQVQHTAMCLDIRAASTLAGIDLLQWPCHGLAHQTFDWQPNSSAPVVLPGEDVSRPVLPVMMFRCCRVLPVMRFWCCPVRRISGSPCFRVK